MPEQSIIPPATPGPDGQPAASAGPAESAESALPSGEPMPPEAPGPHRRATPEELQAAAEAQAKREAEERRAKADRLGPYKWKKGQCGRPADYKGPNREARVRKELRALMDKSVKDMRFATEIALRLNLTPEEINDPQLSLGKLYAMAGFVHAVRGKSAYFTEISKRVDHGNIEVLEDSDEAYAPANPDDERAKAIALYRRVVNSEETTIQQKMDAQRELNMLLGLVVSDSRSAQDKARTVLDAIRQIEEF